MRVRLEDVAREAGVSLAAVSRTLRNKRADSFAPDTRKRIHEAAKRLGYRPNFAAQALASGRTHLVSLWTYHPYQAVAVQVMEHLDQQAHDHGYGLLVSDVATHEGASFQPAFSPVASDGLLALDCGPFADMIARVRPSEETPVVSLGTNVLPGTDAVRIDLAAAFTAAVEHLAAQGCRRIAYFSAPPLSAGRAPTSFATPRGAYTTFMAATGLPAEFIEAQPATRAAARKAIVEYIRAKGCPEAVLCRNDDLVIGAYRAICDLGLEVGRDVLLVGCDGQEDTEYFPCPISTIVFPIAEMCRLAWEHLESRIGGADVAIREATFDARLEIRQSSKRESQDETKPRIVRNTRMKRKN